MGPERTRFHSTSSWWRDISRRADLRQNFKERRLTNRRRRKGGLESAPPWGNISKDVKEIYSLADFQDWRKAGGSAKPPIQLGVIGQPIAHSLSPEMQNAALAESKFKMRYARFEIAPDELQFALASLPRLDFVGVNLTVPHKVAALAVVNDMDETAREIGAINTIKIEDGRLRGFNTDGKGFSRAIREEFAVDLRDLRILVLGAGGAARAIARQCAKENCERLVVANRTFEKANQLVHELQKFFTGPRVLGPVARLQAMAWEESAFRFQ